MQNWNYKEVINALRSLVALLFLCATGAVFLYSQFTANPLSIDTIQLLLSVLLPYFGLDIAANLAEFRGNKEE